jgi:hypothetical protein
MRVSYIKKVPEKYSMKIQVRWMKPSKFYRQILLYQQPKVEWQKQVTAIESSCSKSIAEIIIEVIAYLQIWKTIMK